MGRSSFLFTKTSNLYGFSRKAVQNRCNGEKSSEKSELFYITLIDRNLLFSFVWIYIHSTIPHFFPVNQIWDGGKTVYQGLFILEIDKHITLCQNAIERSKNRLLENIFFAQNRGLSRFKNTIYLFSPIFCIYSAFVFSYMDCKIAKIELN